MRALLIFVIACGAPPANRPLPLGNTHVTPSLPRAPRPPREPVRIAASVMEIDTDGSRVAYLTFANELVGVSIHGDTLYRRRLEKLGGYSTAVKIVDGVAIAMSNERVVAVDATTGAVRWERAAEGSDWLASRIVGSTVWIDGYHSATLDVQTGHDVPRVIPKAPALKIDTKHVADHSYELFATAGGAELWRTTVDSPWIRGTTFVELGDLVVFTRAAGDTSTLVALDARTGSERYTRRLGDGDAVRFGYLGPRFSWFWIIDGSLVGSGQSGVKLLAITPTGSIVRELSLPEPGARYCGGDVKVASTAGVLVVAHTHADRAGGCAGPVVDIHAPR